MAIARFRPGTEFGLQVRRTSEMGAHSGLPFPSEEKPYDFHKGTERTKSPYGDFVLFSERKRYDMLLVLITEVYTYSCYVTI